MLSLKDMEVITAAEGERLGVNSPEFWERHNEIMNLLEQAKSREKVEETFVESK